MPLHINAPEIIRRNLEQIRDGQRTRLVLIGSLTAEQLAVLNAFRLGHGLEPMIDEVLFLGRHLCKSRSKDNYSIDDMLDQIASGMASTSIMRCSLKMSGMQNPQPRQDRYGNQVRIIDRGVESDHYPVWNRPKIQRNARADSGGQRADVRRGP